MKRTEASARRFHLLSDPIRLHILLFLQQREMCVGDLAETLGLDQPKVSYHLKRMYEEGLIKRRTENTWCYYSLSTDIRTWVNQELDLLFSLEPAYINSRRGV